MTHFQELRIRDEAHLRTLPDGTIISWLRIPGDRSSEAVAFVRRQVDYDDGPAGPSVHGGATVNVWITPGGWEPHSVAEAGVSFPCTVVRLGEFQQDQYLGAELPVLGETLAEIGGGTYPRDHALQCAATYMSGYDNSNASDVLAVADEFLAWLDPDPAVPGNPFDQADDESSDPPGPGDVMPGWRLPGDDEAELPYVPPGGRTLVGEVPEFDA